MATDNTGQKRLTRLAYYSFLGIVSAVLKIFGVVAVIVAFWLTLQLVNARERYLYQEFPDIYMYIVGTFFFIPVLVGVVSWGAAVIIDLRLTMNRRIDELAKILEGKHIY